MIPSNLIKKAHEKERRDLRTEFEIKNMELRQLQDKAAAYENENERFQKALLEAHQELANEKVKSETKDQWEVHLSNIIKWIYDEKEARSYLENVANNLSNEIKHLQEQVQ